MNKRDAMALTDQQNRLMALGISRDDADALRRISRTLRYWFELECGTGSGQISISIERDGDAPDSKPYRRIQYPSAYGYIDRRSPIADRETGARRRLAAIMARYPHLTAYVQSDPRGCALYILTAEQLTGEHPIDAIYTRGVAIA